jgi:hypothetical protein
MRCSDAYNQPQENPSPIIWEDVTTLPCLSEDPGTLRNDPVPGLVASFATKKELKSNTFTLSNQLSQGHCVLF